MQSDLHIKSLFLASLTILFPALLGGCFLFPQEEEILPPPLMSAPDVTYQTIEAKRATIEDRITVTGYFSYVQQRSLYFKFRSGRLKAIHINYGDAVQKGDIIAELDTDTLEMQIARKYLDFRKKKLALERIQMIGADKYQREIAALDVEQVQLDIDALEDELSKAQITAPFDGIVTYIGKFQEGDYVDAYRTVVRIADPQELLVSYKGTRSSEFRQGAPVEINISGEKYSGKVIMAPSSLPPDASDDLRETVLVRMDAVPEGVTAGRAASLGLVIQRRENAVVVPRILVRNYMAGKYVYVLEDGIRRERSVQVGLNTPTEIEIVKGLEPGEKVIVR